MGSGERRDRLSRRELARAASRLEAGDLTCLHDLPPGHARSIGLTGPPGAGKSTLGSALIVRFRARGLRVAVIAVDPSSPVTGGALLGDRVRMMNHHGDDGVFIRSLASRGATGGLAPAAARLLRLFDGAGYDVVLLETVGVGQSEIDVARVAQITAAVLTPGYGDDVQASKAGLMEVADVFVINKADQPGADKLARELHAVRPEAPLFQTVARENIGIDELVDSLLSLPAVPKGLPSRHELDHVAISVASIDEALKFYCGQLGMRLLARETVEAEKVHVAMLDSGESRIELLEAAAPDSPIVKRGPGIHHIALKVPDFARSLATLKNSGARLLNEPRAGAGGHRYVFVHPASAGGVLLELIDGSNG